MVVIQTAVKKPDTVKEMEELNTYVTETVEAPTEETPVEETTVESETTEEVEVSE